MKKKLNEIFDEAKPKELDQFSDELNAPELPDEVLASVKVLLNTRLTYLVILVKNDEHKSELVL